METLGCSAKTLKMQQFQSTTKQQMGLGASSVMPSSLGSPCSAVLCPVRQHYHATGKQGWGLPSFEVLGHHSALRRSGAHTVPGCVLGLYPHLMTAIAQNLVSYGSLPLPIPGSTSSRRGCTACSPPTSAISTSTLQIALLISVSPAHPAFQPSHHRPQKELLPCQTSAHRDQDESRPTATTVLHRQLPFSANSVQDFSHWHLKWEMTVPIPTCQQGATTSALGSILVSNTV